MTDYSDIKSIKTEALEELLIIQNREQWKVLVKYWEDYGSTVISMIVGDQEEFPVLIIEDFFSMTCGRDLVYLEAITKDDLKMMLAALEGGDKD